MLIWKTRIALCGMALALFANRGVCRAEELFTEDVRIKKSYATMFLHSPGQAGVMGSEQIWSIEGNAQWMRFYDISNDTNPFSIENNSPDNSLYIDISGSIGMGTDSPEADLHISTPHTFATLRLETQAVPHAWQLEASNTAFRLYDATENILPFTVQTNAPSNSLFVSNMGKGHIGIGTSSPDVIANVQTGANARHLNLNAGHDLARSIVQGGTGAELYLVHKNGGTNRKIVRSSVAGGKYLLSSMTDNMGANIEHGFCMDLTSTNVGVKTSAPTKPFQVGDIGANDGNGAHVTAGGVWTNASSRTVKDDIQPVSLDTARDTIRALQPVTYRYKNEKDEQYVGFIAEDVPDLVATNDRKSLASMDITAVLTRVVQEQDQRLVAQDKINADQKRIIGDQQALLTSMSKRLADLEARVVERAE